MNEPDDRDVVEQDGNPLRLPGWLSFSGGGRPSRGMGAAILGIAGLLIGLGAGYAAGYRHHPAARVTYALSPARPTASPAATGAVPSNPAGFAAPDYPPPAPGGPAYSTSVGTVDLTGLAETGGQCSEQHGRQLQVGVEVINLSDAPITLGQAVPVLPLGGLRIASRQWAPCGALVSSWQAADGGMTVFVRSSTGALEAGSSTPGGAAVLPPNGTAWLSMTFKVLVTCPGPLPVQFKVSFLENGRVASTELPGFADLGNVPYTGCKGGSS